VLVLGLAIQKGKNAHHKVILGAAVLTSLVLAPFIIWGAVEPLLVEVVLIPILTDGSLFLSQR